MVNPMKLTELTTDGIYVSATFTPDTKDILKKIAIGLGVPPSQIHHDFHTTIVYSKRWVDYECVEIPMQLNDGPLVPEIWKTQGGHNCLVLVYPSRILTNRWLYSQSLGAQYDHDTYRPHVTLCYDFKGELATTPIEATLIGVREVREALND